MKAQENSIYTFNTFPSGIEIPRDILDDLCSRFIINVPEEEREDLIRLCFQIELAHWFYLDFYFGNTTETRDRKPCGIKEFASQILKHISYLHPYANRVEDIIAAWKGYKLSVPTFGAILLDENMTHVLLVQSYGSKSSWGFPKGKINKDEPPSQCAVREVYEETGFNIQNLINPNEYIEAQVNEQLVRLYVVPGVSRKEKFKPKTRNEIKAINWFPVIELPATKKEATIKLKSGLGANSFFMVSPFIRRLRTWIFERDKKLIIKLFKRPRYKSCGDLEDFQNQDYPTGYSLYKNYAQSGQIQVEHKKREQVFPPRPNEERYATLNIHQEKPITPSEELRKTKSLPFKQITLSEQFLKDGIPSLNNFRLNVDTLFS